jgi:hypothetical protein
MTATAPQNAAADCKIAIERIAAARLMHGSIERNYRRSTLLAVNRVLFFSQPWSQPGNPTIGTVIIPMADESDPNKRRHHRVPCNQVHRIAPYAGAAPRDEDFKPVMFNDISKSGFSYFTDRVPETTELVVLLDVDPPSRICARVVNHRPGLKNGELIVGCAFTGRLNAEPSASASLIAR